MTRKPAPTPPAAPPQVPGQEAQRLVLYLLHAPVPIRRTRHYLGITREARLAHRLREHAHRRGSSLTAALARRNRELVLARVWSPATWELERQMKATGHYDRLCPVCRHPELDLEHMLIPCPELPDLAELPENVGFGLPLRRR